ncbi:H-2 class I histocompatibility antigen, K-K alpha chain-like, partial [Rhinichthys klamathensis goyatoka]|uniref:H-2 class I histocompatibility antigen, K-K alpha chain-like n=1 Tax=Rhinichthys klamathensis goyatoka TaxID=3034132 RepID=UPI0024B585EF
SSEKHFLHYKFTVLTRSDSFPEFSAVCVYDDRRIKHFSNEERVWILTDKDWTEAPEDPPDSRDWFIHQIRTLSDCTDSLCSELHVLQRRIGCELEKLPDGSVNQTVFDDYGFDGEDLITFNNDTMQWIVLSPNAIQIKQEWDLYTERNKFLQRYLNNCINWISTYNNTNSSSPDVHVSVSKSPADDSKLVLVCLATGFYPRDVQMNIRRNRINLEDQTSSGIRPNDDETFQKRISVKIDRNHEGSYDCRVTHSSLTEPVTVNWGKYHHIYPHIFRHEFYYMFTVLTIGEQFPTFRGVGVVDDRQIAQCSSEVGERIIANLIKFETKPKPFTEPYDSSDWYKYQLYRLSKCTQCSELHVLQRRIGCELEKLPDGSVNQTVFDDYGFDGEDLITFNNDTMQWIVLSPNAIQIKQEWDLYTERNKFLQRYLNNCINWISTYNNTNSSSPDVHVSVSKSPADDSKLVLVCLATGFYPRDVQMNIRRNRINLEDQTSSGIRPNDDETFQKRISVKIDRNHEGSYDCRVTHSSLTEPVTVNWDGKCSNCEPESGWSIAGVMTVVGAVAVVLGLTALIGFCWYKRRPNEEKFFLLRRSDRIPMASPDSTMMIMDLQADGSERVIK